MGQIGLPEILIIAAVVLSWLGVKDIPRIVRSVAEVLKEFKKLFKSSDDK